MAQRKPHKVKRSGRRSSVLPVLMLVGVAALLSLGIAGVWQMASGGGDDAPSSVSSAADDAQADANQSSVPASDTSASQPSSETETPTPSSDDGQKDPAGPAVGQSVLGESERVKSEYFDDAAFIGDSLTTGIDLYGIMPNADVYAETGVSTIGFSSAQVIKQDDGSRITIPQALEGKEYAKLYVMLGGNDTLDDPAAFAARYEAVLDTLRTLQPQAIIYVQSILPVTENNIYNLTNEHINSFNEALVALCEKKGVYYVDVAQAFKDEDGNLPIEASPADGMHFDGKYYTKWMDYLKTHTAPGA